MQLITIIDPVPACMAFAPEARYVWDEVTWTIGTSETQGARLVDIGSLHSVGHRSGCRGSDFERSCAGRYQADEPVHCNQRCSAHRTGHGPNVRTSLGLRGPLGDATKLPACIWQLHVCQTRGDGWEVGEPLWHWLANCCHGAPTVFKSRSLWRQRNSITGLYSLVTCKPSPPPVLNCHAHTHTHLLLGACPRTLPVRPPPAACHLTGRACSGRTSVLAACSGARSACWTDSGRPACSIHP